LKHRLHIDYDFKNVLVQIYNNDGILSAKGLKVEGDREKNEMIEAVGNTTAI
jgi:hypothetical protein